MFRWIAVSTVLFAFHAAAQPTNSQQDPAPASANEPPAAFPLTEQELQVLIRREEPAINEKSARIDLELAGLGREKLNDRDWAKEWAGTYYTGDGLGMNVTIKIAPKSGVTYTWRGCLGLYDANHGEIVGSFPGGVDVKLAIDQRASSYGYMSNKLYFVRWGDRKYLVPKYQMFAVVNNYNEGGFARESMFSIPRLNSKPALVPRDEGCPPGRPELPAEYADLIVGKPTTLKITGITTKPTKDIVGHDCLLCMIELDGGRDRGVFVGMKISYDGRGGFGNVEITSVEETRSTAELFMFGGENRQVQAPPVGTVLQLPGAQPDAGTATDSKQGAPNSRR